MPLAAKTPTLLAVAALVALTVAPPAAAQTTSTICYGGTTDSSTLRVDSTRLSGMDIVIVQLYLSYRYLDMWEDTNGNPGLQRTDYMCTERTVDDNGVILSSYTWIETPADTSLVA